MDDGWIELRCHRSLKGKLHAGARVIEIACSQGRSARHGVHGFDWFDADTGRRLSILEVRFRLSQWGNRKHGISA